MMARRNPKQVGSCLYDCKPQIGLCPMNCRDCYYNAMGKDHDDVKLPIIPTLEEVGDGIVRMNSLHDSNIDKEIVIKTAKQYKHVFFNTSISNFDFPGPVVYTAGMSDLTDQWPSKPTPNNLMFVRVIVSYDNEHVASRIISYWVARNVHVVLTLMRYKKKPNSDLYELKKHISNDWWCPTEVFKTKIADKYSKHRLINMCGTINSDYCKDCRNCEFYYHLTMKRLQGWR